MDRANNQAYFDSLIINNSNVNRIKKQENFQHSLIKIFNCLKRKVIKKKKKNYIR